MLDWMETHVLFNDKIDKSSLRASTDTFLENGGMENLFDDVFTSEEWAEAEAQGKQAFGAMHYSNPRLLFTGR